MKLTQNRLNSIDALRGLAALIIVFYHARPMFYIGLSELWKQYGLSVNLNAWLGYATFPLSWGALAVELFFILSGYCIHRRGAKNLAVNPDTRIDLKKFFLRRLWRIYPVYFVALCITAIVDAYVRAYYPNLIPIRQDNSAFSFVMSLLSLQGIAAPIFGSNTVFWTLALELHFYLLYPLLYYISRKHSPLKVLVLTFIASISYVLIDLFINISNYLPYQGSGGPIFLPYCFLWGFGFYLAEVEANRAFLPKKFWLIALLGIIVTIPASLLKNYVLARFASVFPFTALIYWSITPKGERFWSGSIGSLFTNIGLFSYSLYAIHRPVLLMFKVAIAGEGEVFTTVLPAFLASLLAVAGGWILFILVERWTLKPLFSKKSRLAK